MNTYTIGQASQITGLSKDALRFYEKMALVHSKRSPNNYRYYTDQDIEQLTLIRHCRDLGLSLEQINALIALKNSPDADCTAIDEAVAEYIAQIEQKITELLAIKQFFMAIPKCQNTRVQECHILHSLQDNAVCQHDSV